MSRKGSRTEEDTVLRRSTRTRTRQGVVLNSGWDHSSDSDVYRVLRETWSLEAVTGRVEYSSRSENRMSRKEIEGDRDLGRGGSEQSGLTDLFQMLLADNRRRDDEARAREELERRRRDDENSRREEEHRSREQRWAEQLQAVSARPEPRFPPHFDKRSLLQLTSDCKDLDAFVTVFEAQLTMEEVALEEWKALLIGQLDASHRLRVADLVADADSTYHDIVQALRVSGGDTGLSAAQRYFRAEPDPSKFTDVQKGLSVLGQWSQKIAAGAKTVNEALGAMDRARMRAYPNLGSF